MAQDISWPAVCGNSSKFWDFDLAWNSSSPDLPECFQHTVLVWIPCGLLWVLSVGYLPILCCVWPKVNTWQDKGWINWLKMVIVTLVIGTSLTELIHTILQDWEQQDAPLYLYLEPSIRLASFILSLVLVHLEFSRGRHTSGVQFVFLLIFLLLGIVPFYSNIKKAIENQGSIDDTLRFVMFYVSYGLLLVLLGLYTVSDRVALQYTTRLLEEERAPLLGEFSLSREDEGQQQSTRAACPEESASFLSCVTNWWIVGMIWRGYRRTLQFDDVYKLLDVHRSEEIISIFGSEWDKREETWRRSHPGQQEEETEDDIAADGVTKKAAKQLAGPSLVMTLFKTSKYYLLISGLCRLFTTFWTFLNPLLLQEVITFVSSNDQYYWKGYLLAVALLLVNMTSAVIQHQYFKYALVTALRNRSAIINSVYRKALRLSNYVRQTTTVGEIVNLMAVDAQKVHDITFNVHEIWACPLTIAIAMYMLWQMMGPASMAGLAVLIILALVNGGVFGRKFTLYQAAQMRQKDVRIKAINEMLAGIKVLKMYAWEPSCRSQVDTIRGEEMSIIRKQAYMLCGIDVTIMCSSYLISLVIFAVYLVTSEDHYLSPQQAFVTLNLIQTLNFATTIMPIIIAFGAQAFVSIKRIVNMLMQDDIDVNAVSHDQRQESMVSIDNGTFSWRKTGTPTLRNVNLKIKEGKLTAVVGQVGCGKSSLISAILGEMIKLTGDVNVKGAVAYVSQQAWIQNMTLRKNVLFDKPVNESRYHKVIDACALTPDLKVLPGGDKTEIGEKGINLSGGQKQRVSLARAVYQSEDVYLLDDPLSAVDAHVAKHIFEKVIGPQGLLKDKTRLLVTHGITYLPQMDQIIVLKDGQVSEVGAYKDLLQNDGSFADFLRTYMNEASSDEESDPEVQEIQRQLSAISSDKSRSETSQLKKTRRRKGGRSLTTRSSKSSMKEGTPSQRGPGVNKIIEEEAAMTGNIQWDVIMAYIRASGYCILLLLVAFHLLHIASVVSTNIWLSAWSDDPIYEDPQEGIEQTNLRLGVYGGLGVGQVIATFGTSLCVMTGGVIASRRFHSRLLDRMLRAPMAFFDTTPLGRIVNRFSTDMDKLDTVIPMTSRFLFMQFATVICTLILITYSTPIFLSVLVPLVIVYLIIQRIYIKTLRQLKRIDSIRRSPIYVNFDETLTGVTCVRAFSRQKSFIDKNDQLMDESQMAWYPVCIAQRWLGFFLDTMAAFVVFAAAMFAVYQRDSLTGGLAGLSVSFSLQTTFAINMLLRGVTEMETHIVSVERIKEYSEVECEAPWEVAGNTPSVTWPDQGKVEFTNYSTRYRSGLDLVLRGLSFSVNPGEKVGIVGRTGAGKSSMALSLFRIIEPAGGSIIIDDVIIDKIGLHDLRSKLTIIPQDPVIFSGSIRKNLDPFETYFDDAIWAVLEHAHLKDFVQGLPEGLDYECGEGGDSLSVGQRQLLCLARALLRKSKILILDEATAAVDMETDELIQNTIGTAFKGCTVLTVAHRLNTIMDYDRVMVLDDGVLREFDSPQTLIEDKNSRFHGMAKDANII